MTYLWCGMDGWCYLFNVVDTFTRKRVGYSFDVSASKDAAVESVINAMTSEKPDASGLTIQTDNGSQYVSRKFRESVQIPSVRQEFIYHHTFKKEYIWPHEFANYQEAEVAIAKAFSSYNQARIYSAPGYLTPNEFARSCGMRNK
ncbi:MAG: transposase [Candidatus Nitrosotenuis sp.]